MLEIASTLSLLKLRNTLIIIAIATALSAALTPIEKRVMKKPSSSPGNSRRLNAAKLISTALSTSSIEMSIAMRLRRVTKP